MINQVYDFNEQVIGVDVKSIEPLNNDAHEWLIKALKEEVYEIIDAHNEQDVVKYVDGVLDLCYFAIGALVRMGLTRSQALECFMAIHNANMTKKKGSQAKRGDFVDDAIKPENFTSPDQVIYEILFGDE